MACDEAACSGWLCPIRFDCYRFVLDNRRAIGSEKCDGYGVWVMPHYDENGNCDNFCKYDSKSYEPKYGGELFVTYDKFVNKWVVRERIYAAVDVEWVIISTIDDDEAYRFVESGKIPLWGAYEEEYENLKKKVHRVW